jgi:tetratricopeptide (TPR) repeat protein
MNESNQQISRAIQTAEGYLELMSAFESGLSIDTEMAQPLADRILKTLSAIKSPRGHRSYIVYLMGEACRIAERFDQGVIYFQQSLEIEPENIHCLLAVAWCFKRCGLLEQAIESMQIAIEFEPERAICHYNLACYFALTKQTLNAIEYLSQAFELKPSFRQQVDDEPDFDPIRDDQEFVEFLSPVA